MTTLRGVYESVWCSATKARPEEFSLKVIACSAKKWDAACH
jgi:hypothetical protein